MKPSMLVCSAALAAAVAAPVLAQDFPLSANLSLVSNYKFRGLDQSNNKPALQGGFDFEAGGFYIGNWNSSISFANGIEMDVYGGYAGEFGNGLGYDVGILQYLYPGDSNANTTELYAGLSFGPFGAKYSHTVSKRWFGIENGRGSGYLALSYEQELMPRVTVAATVGFSQFRSSARAAGDVANYTDYSVGASYDLGNDFALGAAIVGATKRSFWGDGAKTRLIVSLSKSM